MSAAVVAFGRNLGIFLAAYPLALLASIFAAIAKDRFLPNSIGFLDIIFELSFYESLEKILEFFRFIIIPIGIPCSFSFFILKICGFKKLTAYLSVNTFITLILIEPLMFVPPELDNRVEIYPLLKAAIEPLALFMPSLIVGTVVFHVIENRILRACN